MALRQPVFRLVRLYETNGSILCRYYDATAATTAVLWLGGAGGGFDSPAHGLFDRLAVSLMNEGTSSLRIRYRLATDLASSVEDALVGIEFLAQRGVERIAAVGHSLGAAVAIQSGAASPLVVAVAGLASQSFGTEAVGRLTPRPLLLVHGEQDDVLPPECSTYVYDHASEPRQLVLLPRAGHCFEEAEPELRQLLSSWLKANLATDRPAARSSDPRAGGPTESTA